MRRAAAIAVVGLLLLPAGASAHAQLISMSPQRGAQLDEPLTGVSVRFDEPIEASFGAVRVYSPTGERVDDGELTRPAGDTTIGTQIRAAGDGVYTVTYRVVSADGHPISGGYTYTVGEAGPAANQTVAELLEQQRSGTTTTLAYGVVRTLGYLAIALAVGGLAFAAFCWSRITTAPKVTQAFERALRRILVLACLIGIATTGLAIVSQAAVAQGGSFWQALDQESVRTVADTRTGLALACRLGAWLLLAAVLALAIRGWNERFRDPMLATAVLAVTGLVMLPGLGGHAGIASPSSLSVLANSVHVAAMSVWVGGIVTLLLAVPAATRATALSDRSRLLLDAVSRFSTVAMFAAAVVILSGLVQTVIQVPSFADLTGTAFGRAILVKTAIVGALLGIGALHRTRLIPRLMEVKKRRGGTGAAGHSLRTALRVEVALMVVVLGVSAALVSYSPAPASSGVVSESFDLGSARTEVSVSPLTRGPQEIHIYLFDAETGQPLRRAGTVRAKLALPDRGIGPIAVDLRKGGPGHFTATETVSVAGEWRLTITRRSSRFDSDAHELEMTIR